MDIMADFVPAEVIISVHLSVDEAQSYDVDTELSDRIAAEMYTAINQALDNLDVKA